jgi:hypothetical protein
MSEPTIDEMVSMVLDVFGDEPLTEYLRKRNAKRCKQCSFHEPTQGHAAGCPRRKVKSPGILFEGSDICAACGESFSEPGFTSRCRSRHMEGCH